jgi:hypothetical protein
MELIGKELINKIKNTENKNIRDLAISCGYGFESLDNQGNTIIKARRKKFIQAVINAGGEVNLFWLDDPYENQKKYQAKNKEKKAQTQANWLENNRDKVKQLKQTEEYKQKNREQALASYHRRKAKEKTVEKLVNI